MKSIFQTLPPMKLFEKIKSLCKELEGEFDQITDERKLLLLDLRGFFERKFAERQLAKAIVICTHNSRRSHLGQLWLSVAATYYDLPKIETFSGGTEATAFNPRAVQAARKAGFEIETSTLDASNPIYQIRWQEGMEPYEAFSKKYDVAPNPTDDFAAIMVCNSADAECPFVPGASFRIALPFDDPKAFDDTDLEGAKYMERLRQIGREFLWVMSEDLKIKGAN